ncbi:MAG TPA: protein kinase, partial [Miltoncostaeaceae bacterium]|nr:protein kinase [Miltoncostaeaceae bacterium]
MVGTPPSRLRRTRERAPRPALVLAMVLLGASFAVPTPAGAEEEQAPKRVWGAIKGVPGKIGSATRKAAQRIGDGFEREPGDAEPPKPAPGARPGGKPVARPARPRPEARPEPVPAPAAAAPAAPQPATHSLPQTHGPSEPTAALPAPNPDRRALRAAVLIGAFLAALAGVGLALTRRRRPEVPAPAATAPPPASPPETAEASVSFAQTVPLHAGAGAGAPPGVTRPLPRDTLRIAPEGRPTVHRPTAFDAAALDVRTEAAVADALAGDAARPTPFPGGGRYELLAEIGRGGMGVVYQARDKRLDRIVALKRLPENLQAHPRAVQLLLREARSAARLNHPHIVTVYDVDHEDGGYFLTMEFLEGHPLSTLLHRRGRFAPAEATWLARQAAAGLAYAHERRIVHRDVKTANLFLTRDRVLKIMDFGLAKVIEAVRRRATRIGGTPDYMAPEQTLGLEVDGRADLYALGVTLYELLTGTVPFEDGDTMRHHRETPPPDPRERAPETPADLAALVLQLLAKKPDERPATAAI